MAVMVLVEREQGVSHLGYAKEVSKCELKVLQVHMHPCVSTFCGAERTAEFTLYLLPDAKAWPEPDLRQSGTRRFSQEILDCSLTFLLPDPDLFTNTLYPRHRTAVLT